MGLFEDMLRAKLEEGAGARKYHFSWESVPAATATVRFSDNVSRKRLRGQIERLAKSQGATRVGIAKWRLRGKSGVGLECFFPDIDTAINFAYEVEYIKNTREPGIEGVSTKKTHLIDESTRTHHFSWEKDRASSNKLRSLQKQVERGVRRRGHDMGRWETTGKTSISSCRLCGMEAFVDTSPPPNGIDISGEAVAMFCRPNRSFSESADTRSHYFSWEKDRDDDDDDDHSYSSGGVNLNVYNGEDHGLSTQRRQHYGNTGQKTLTYGILPSPATFHTQFEREVHGDYRSTLRGEDARTAHRWSSVVTDRMDVWDLWQFVHDLTNGYNRGSENAGDLVSSVLQTLGFEWI